MEPKLQQHITQEHSQQREMDLQQAKERVARGEKPWEEPRGVYGVVEAVRDCRFPAGVGDLAQSIGDREVYVAGEQRVAMRHVLGKLKDDTYFPSLKEFQTAVQRHWEGIRNLVVPPEQRPTTGGRPPP